MTKSEFKKGVDQPDHLKINNLAAFIAKFVININTFTFRHVGPA